MSQVNEKKSLKKPLQIPTSCGIFYPCKQYLWLNPHAHRVAGVVGLLGMLAGPFLVILTGHGGGLAERIALYPLIIWLIVFGLFCRC